MMSAMKEWVTHNISPSSGWFLWAPLVAAYAPRGLHQMYINRHVRRYATRLVPFLDPFVTIDIVSKQSSRSSDGQLKSSSDAYEEVKAYLAETCSRDVLEFSAEGAVDGRSFSFSLREGQEVADIFDGVTVWWLSVPSNRAWDSCLRLMFPHKHRELIQQEYLPQVREKGRDLMFVTIDIISKSSSSSSELESSDEAYKEVKAYLSSKCSQDKHVLGLCAEGTVHVQGDSFLLSLQDQEGHEVADQFRDVTLWWSSVPPASKRYGSEETLRLMFPQQHRKLIMNEYLPHVRREGRDLMYVTIDIISKSSKSSSQLESSDAYEEVNAYLSSRCSRDVLGLCAEGTVQGDSFLLSLQEGQAVADQFNDITLWWSVPPSKRYGGSEETLRLMFPQQQRRLIVDEYLPHVRREGRNRMFRERRLKLYTNKRDLRYETDDVWSHIDFNHPATFDTLAMPRTEKQKIKDDLENFRGNKNYYRRIGKAWKRGYLLCGPAGTGKSSMIAAMANYLKYDIYDIELTTVNSNSDLRKLLVKTTSKSIIVIEDIDCSDHDFTGQRSKKGRRKKKNPPGDEDDFSKVTLSGLLNFIEGLWSSAQSGERIIVLTTNFPDNLDQALIRRGRMDVRVEMSNCCFEAFETLARNYLGVGAHPLFEKVKELLQVVEITPADVAESLLPSQADVAEPDSGAEKCLERLIDELENRPKKRKRTGEDTLNGTSRPVGRRRRRT